MCTFKLTGALRFVYRHPGESSKLKSSVTGGCQKSGLMNPENHCHLKDIAKHRWDITWFERGKYLGLLNLENICLLIGLISVLSKIPKQTKFKAMKCWHDAVKVYILGYGYSSLNGLLFSRCSNLWQCWMSGNYEQSVKIWPSQYPCSHMITICTLNKSGIKTITLSTCYMITISDLPCQFFTSKVNKEANRNSAVTITQSLCNDLW